MPESGEFFVLYDVAIDRYIVPNWSKGKVTAIWPSDISMYNGTGMYRTLIECYNNLMNLDFDCDSIELESVVIFKGSYQDKYFMTDFCNPIWIGKDDEHDQ